MRKLLAVLIVSAFFVQIGFSAGKSFVVDIYVGKVQVSKNRGKSWKPAASEMELKESDWIKTGKNSYCDILMPDRGVFRAGDNSTILLSKISLKNTRINIKKGKAVVKVSKKLDMDETFSIETIIGVASVRGTEFIMDTDNDTLGLSVNEGTVALKRNVRIPKDVELDEEMQKYLEVEATVNQSIEFTMSENKALEKMINRVKNNKDELISALRNSRDADRKKLKIMKKNINRVFEELGMEDPENVDNGGDDDTGDVINKIKSKKR